MSYVLSKKTVSTAKGVGVSSEKYPKLHLVDVMSDTWYPIPPCRVVRQVVKDLKGMWEQNISAKMKISTRINEVVNEFDAAQVKSEALDKSIRKMKADLKSYSNSAFYREDRTLIKEMHSRICPGRILPGEERINNPSPGEPIQTAAEYVKELRNRMTQPKPPVEPIEPVRRHSDSSVTVPSANVQIESRRSCGNNMTMLLKCNLYQRSFFRPLSHKLNQLHQKPSQLLLQLICETPTGDSHSGLL